jgi:hypothetical protein
VDVLDGLDKVALTQDEVDIVGFLDFYRHQLHIAPPLTNGVGHGDTGSFEVGLPTHPGKVQQSATQQKQPGGSQQLPLENRLVIDLRRFHSD